MKITDIRCAIIGDNPIVRIVTNAGLSGFGPVEHTKPFIKPHIAMLREALIGDDPTLVERIMIKLRPRGAFKPWGAAVRRERRDGVGQGSLSFGIAGMPSKAATFF